MALTEASRLSYYDARYDPLKMVAGPDAVFSRNGGAWELAGGIYRPRIVNQPVIEDSIDTDGLPASHVWVRPSVAVWTPSQTDFAAGGTWSYSINATDIGARQSVFLGEAARLVGTSGGEAWLSDTHGVFDASDEALLGIFEQNPANPHPVGKLGIYDTTIGGAGGRFLGVGVLNYATGVLSTSLSGPELIAASAQKLADSGPNGGAVWAVILVVSSVAGNGRRLYGWATDSTGGTNDGTIWHYLGSFDPGTGFAGVSGPVIGAAGSVQAAETMHFPEPFPFQAHAGVLDCIIGELDIDSAGYLFSIGDGTSTPPRFHVIYEGALNRIRVFEQDGVATRDVSRAYVGAKPGDRIRVLWRSRADSLSIETWVEGVGTGPTTSNNPSTFPQWLSNTNLHFGASSVSGGNPLRSGVQRCRIVKAGDLDATVWADVIDELTGYYLDPAGRLVA